MRPGSLSWCPVKKAKYFACDFETTGLLAPTVASLDKQPYIVQIAAITLDAKLNTIEEISCLVRPPVHIPAEVSKIHGITDAMVKDEESFRVVSCWFLEALEGLTWIGQNSPFDLGVLYHELRRIGKKTELIPSIDLMDLIVARWGKRRKLGDVYQDLFGRKLEGAHDALFDIRATVECMKALRKELNV